MRFDSNTDSLITPKELADMFKISKSSVYRLIDKRRIPFFKIGGKLRFSEDDVIKYLNDVRIEPMTK